MMQFPWQNEAVDVDGFLEDFGGSGADVVTAVDMVIEGHWPAVPTYRVVTKPKPAAPASPKPQVSATAHASVPKRWGVNEGDDETSKWPSTKRKKDKPRSYRPTCNKCNIKMRSNTAGDAKGTEYFDCPRCGAEGD